MNKGIEPSLRATAKQSRLRRRPTISELTRPIGLYPSLHSERSEATRGSAAARPLIWRRLVRRRRKSSRPFLHDRLWKCVGGPLVDRGMASLARTGSGRGNGNARSSSSPPSRVISFWASPKSELIPLLSRINSAVNPLLIRCYGGRVSPVRAEFIADSRRGERGFATISLPRGFCSRRGGRRSAMPSQFENPMMISLFENNKVCDDYFSHSERLRMLITGEWRVANGDAERTIRNSLFAIPIGKGRRDETRGCRRRPRPIGRDASRLPPVERASA